MATEQGFVEHLQSQSGLGRALSFKKMFGEYALYLEGRVVAFACDNQLFLKPTEAGRALLGQVAERPPYPGAKLYFLIDEQLDDRDLMRQVFLATALALPLPKPKPPPSPRGQKEPRQQRKRSPSGEGEALDGALAALAADYAKGMTSIRGRRVQRLLKREFAGAAHVLGVQPDTGMRAILGLSDAGAAWCATDGRGPQASIVRWRHGATEAVETHYDLLKDSLPVLGTGTLRITAGQKATGLRVSAGSVPASVQPRLADALAVADALHLASIEL